MGAFEPNGMAREGRVVIVLITCVSIYCANYCKTDIKCAKKSTLVALLVFVFLLKFCLYFNIFSEDT